MSDVMIWVFLIIVICHKEVIEIIKAFKWKDYNDIH